MKQSPKKAAPIRKITVDLDEAADAALRSIVHYHEPFVSSHAVCVAAIRLALTALADEPSYLKELLRSQGAEG